MKKLFLALGMCLIPMLGCSETPSCEACICECCVESACECPDGGCDCQDCKCINCSYYLEV